MSLVAELRSVEERVLARLRELEPLVSEYHELKAHAERLGLDVEAAGAAGPEAQAEEEPRERGSAPAPSTKPRARGGGAAAKKPKRRAAAPKTASRAGNGERERQVVDAVAARPGITVAELAKGLSLEAAALYRVVRLLTDDGTLSKRGRQLYPGD